MKGRVEVLHAGAFSTIQDLGRPGHRQYGVPVSGAMDLYSARLANTLVKNNAEQAVMEITLSGPGLRFRSTALVALAGADISPRLNDAPVLMHSPFLMKAGEILSFGKLRSGCRAYLSVNGGFQTDEVLDSRSFLEGITKKGRLEKGDVVPVKEFKEMFEPVHASVSPTDFHHERLQALPGPEWDKLSEGAKEQLVSTSFTISRQANRMGYRLNELLKIDPALPQILTAVVIPGTVQLTPSGQLIILMRDCQTTGGYPRVLQLTREAVNLLAQKRSGEALAFQVST